MFCPGCGIQVSDDLKFCRQCGANLRGVQEAMVSRTAGDKFDWSKTWVAEMFMTEEEHERRRGITPEIKRLNEIKGGVITSLAGIGAMIFLNILLNAIANAEGGKEAEMLRTIWTVGIVPFLVGVGLIFNGLFISKRIVKLKAQQFQSPRTPQSLPADERSTDPLAIPSTSGSSTPVNFGVTEHTTAHLSESVPARSRREMN